MKHNKSITISLAAVVAMLVLGLTTSCTQNIRAKAFGGTVRIDAPVGKTVVNMTWKEGSNLWVQYRDRRPDEKPVTTTFQEYSSFGLLEGVVIVTEK